MTAAGSLRAGCVLLAAGALGWLAAQHGLPVSDWTVCLLATVGALHVLEGAATLTFQAFHGLVRTTVVRQLRRMPFPDALADRESAAPEWAPPRTCPRCGTVRPSVVTRCPTCR